MEKVCKPVHVGTIAWESAGAASLLMMLVADPFTAVRPMLAEGLAVVLLATFRV